mgnify:CR=1 FL=1
MPDLETKSLIGVEVFAVGEWNGDKWTSKDLDTLVDAFDATKAALRPYIKLGHGDRQVLLERDSLPAAGWIDRLYRAGNKLLADISGIPGKLHAILKAGGYKRVSAEVFIRPKVDGKIYEKALKAVSFLGGETPAVSNLNDILAAYGRDVPKTDQEAEIKVYEVQTDGRHTEETNMAEIELLQKELARKDTEITEATKKLAATEAKVKELEGEVSKEKTAKAAAIKENETLKADNEKLYTDKRKSEVSATIDKLIRDKKVVPAQKDALEAILMDSGSVSARKFSVGGKDYKNASELVLSFVEAGIAPLNTNTETDAGEKQASDLSGRAKQYAEKNKVSYKEALFAVSAEDEKAKAKA